MEQPNVTAVIKSWLITSLSQRLGMDAKEIDVQAPFASYGLTSIEGIGVIQELSDWLNRSLSPTLAWEYPTIEDLANYLAGNETLESTSAVLSQKQQVTNEPIAIVGMACRFPGADNLEEFWQVLANGIDTITDVPAERWDKDAFYHPDPTVPGKMVSRRGGFLKDVDKFDAHFFGISPREAVQVDPRQRIALEMAWEALEDAGIPPHTLAESRTGVYMATLNADYGTTLFTSYIHAIDAYSGSGNANSVVANRISYFLDLRGPSISLDTACSGALVATHLACQNLRSGEADLALVGGVNLILRPDSTIFFSKAGALSPAGKCKTFDSDANGMVRSEGVGVIVLKPLSQALADDDTVYAVIQGSAVTQNGRSNGLMAPNGQAQEAVLRQAYLQAGIHPRQVQYVETHGTGTKVGDPVEVKALASVVAEDRSPDHYCAIGSVKTNLGHTEATAGIAGLIKTALCIQKRKLVPSLHLEDPNPLIPFDNLPIQVQQTLGDWPSPSQVLIAGVSSFGIGGSNAHIVLAEPQENHFTPTLNQLEHTNYLLPLSARTPQALQALVRRYDQFVADSDISLKDICYTASVHRSHLEYRQAFAFDSKEELRHQIKSFSEEINTSTNSISRIGNNEHSGIVFVFSGQGSHWCRMGLALLETEPVFKAVIEHCDRLLQKLADWSLLAELSLPEDESHLNETEKAQPAIFAIQVGLAALWRSWGIIPEVIVGQSLGEIAAAHVAGALSIEDALKVVVYRSQLMQQTTGQGKTAVVGLPSERAKLILTGWEDEVSFAGSNSPNMSVLSGDPDVLARILTSLEKQNIYCRLLKGVDVAFHSSQMEPLKDQLVEKLKDIQPHPTTLRLVSTVTGESVAGADLNGTYWGRNLREPFLFTEVMQQLLKDGYHTFLEINAHPVLSASMTEGVAHANVQANIISSLRRQQPERLNLLASLAKLYKLGHTPLWRTLYPVKGSKITLPSYPWQRERYWLFDQTPSTSFASHLHPSETNHPLLGKHTRLAMPVGQQVWKAEIDINLNRIAYLKDHRVQGAVVFPGAGYLEMALSAASQKTNVKPTLSSVLFKQALVLSENQERQVELILTPETTETDTFYVFSLPSQETSDRWQLHATGKVHYDAVRQSRTLKNIADIQARCSEQIAGLTHYENMVQRSLQYGPAFQAVTQVWRRDGEALAHIKCPDNVSWSMDSYQVHPVLLDACFQVVATALPNNELTKQQMRLPTGVDSVHFHQSPQADIWCHAILRPNEEIEDEIITVDMELLGEDGTILGYIHGLQLQKLDSTLLTADVENWLYEIRWQEKAHLSEQISQAVDYMPKATEIIDQVQPLADMLSEEHELAHYEESMNEQDQLSTVYMVQGLQALGWMITPGQQVTCDQLMSDLQILPQHRRLLMRMLEILEEDGVLQDQENGRWHVLKSPTSTLEVASYGKKLFAKYPASESLLTLIKNCGEKLVGVLRGTYDPVEILFPGGSFKVIEGVNEDTPYSRVYNTLIAHALRVALNDLPANRKLRVLEIGAGTGATTSSVLPQLPAEQTDYIFTDIAPLFLARAKEKFENYPFVTYQPLNIEKDTKEQGFEAQSFDIIIAANVLHATNNLTEVLGRVQNLLAPEGLLILREGAGPQRWMDLTFGLTDGWWRFTDTDLRPSYPLLSREEWQSLLQTVGFTQTVHLTDGRAVSPQFVTLAKGFQKNVRAEEVLQGQSEGNWIILADKSGVGQQLAQKLRYEMQDVTIATYADEYHKQDDEHFYLDPSQPKHFLQLLEDNLALQSAPLRGIIHLWGLDADITNEGDLEQAFALNSASVTYLLQALVNTPFATPPRIWLVTRGAQPSGLPAPLAMAQTPLWGLGRVLAIENPEYWGGIIDLDNTVQAEEINPLFRDIWSPDGENEISYRQGQRHVARLLRRREIPTSTSGLSVRVDGSYLITGGLGGIGLKVAAWLVEKGARRLILMGRTPIPPRVQWDQIEQDDPLAEKIDAIRQLEAEGATIHLAVVDVGNKEDLAAFLDTYQQEGWPPIRGVIHSAGLIKDQLLIRMDMETFKTVTRPKIRGSWFLHTLLADAPLDFFILFSSATSLQGMVGQANYAAGNTFVDALAHHRRALGLPAIAINWGLWSEVGIVARMKMNEQLVEQGLINISPKQGLQALELICQCDFPQIGIMAMDWKIWQQVHPMAHKIPRFSRLIEEELATSSVGSDQETQTPSLLQELILLPPEERPEQVQTYLLDLFASIMRIAPNRIDINQPSSSLGIDSIMAVELNNRIEVGFGVKLTLVELLQGPSVAQLAAEITAKLQIDDDLDTLLDEIEELSTDEVLALLAES